MIRILVTCCGATAFLFLGCQADTNSQLPELNAGMIHWHQIEQVDAAIIREHTIYAHGFVTHRAELNEIGQRNVTVLARHFEKTGGSVNVGRGDASDDLYASRVDAVMNALTAAGVPRDLLMVDDGLPGGDGMHTEAVLRVLERAESDAGSSTNTASTMAGSGTNPAQAARNIGNR